MAVAGKSLYRGKVAEPEKVLVGELNKWGANPLGPGQTSTIQIKTRSA